ncbi:MAG: DUF11 domain-containing protein, partial [Oscillospiraceae bacterium]|nr:DUF11 domain-containing protein [Oscillospiraceae bacterium]
ADKAEVLPGELITYGVMVTNDGPASAKTPAVSDNVPYNVENPAYSVDNGVKWLPWAGSVTLPDLAANATAEILIRARVRDTATGSLVNTSRVTTSTPHPDGSKDPVDSLPCVTAVTPSSRLVTAISAEGPPPAPGDAVILAVTVTNNGPAHAAGVALTEIRPQPGPANLSAAPPALSALDGTQYSLDGGDSWNQWAGTADLADLPAGSGVRVLLKGNVPQDAADSIVMVMESSSSSHHPAPEQGVATILISVISIGEGGSADLEVAAGADALTVRTCCPVTYDITVTNNGPDTAQAPVVRAWSTALACMEYSLNLGMVWQPWTGSATLGELPGGGSSRLLIRGTVAPNASGFVTATITAASPTPDPNPDNNAAVVRIPISDQCHPCCGEEERQL